MSLIRRALEKRLYAPAGGGDPWAIPSNGSLAAVTASGVPVTDDTAMQLIAVSACVRILSDAVAGLPFDAVKADGEIRKTVEPPPAIVADPFGGANDSRLPTRRLGISQLMVSLLLRGNAYCLVLARDHLHRPTRLRVLHPDRVDCQFDNNGDRVYTIDRKPVDAWDVVHILGMSYPESPTGISVISHARQAIGLGLAAEEFGARFFGAGAHMSGIIHVPGDLDKERARMLKDSFTASHGGLRNSHTVGVLSGGAEWKPISVTPDDAQFLGTRAAQNLDIAMLFGIPPHMLGQVDKTTSWGTGIEQQGIGFLAYTLSAWLGRFEDAWSAMLPKPQTAKFNADALLRTDTAGRYAVYGAARTAGLLTPNEIRALENYGPVDGGDDINAPLNSNVKPMKDTQAGKSEPTADALGAVL
ncbi:phage portal protein [Kitasatospora cathayae]|uniref:Phage portal protein n=1 Tax=Kitasatospora cathayae TaxID=3004092 RepID=A0ABY7Q2Y6_9ACTN|nr:phage portal protein [Kitasatospora sp. HUAS 3-15]WBP87046.1 phage portal protein [Kitasatospora sp. HUAS 3-15]